MVIVMSCVRVAGLPNDNLFGFRNITSNLKLLISKHWILSELLLTYFVDCCVRWMLAWAAI